MANMVRSSSTHFLSVVVRCDGGHELTLPYRRRKPLCMHRIFSESCLHLHYSSTADLSPKDLLCKVSNSGKDGLSGSLTCSHGRSSNSGPLCTMAVGLGVSRNYVCLDSGDGFKGSGGGGSSRPMTGQMDDTPHGDADITEIYYQKLLQSDPQNPLLLQNYAQFLLRVKHDHKRAEEYYERAILASPGDGRVLSTYAELLWNAHRDTERANMYFEQAIKASPDDCYVSASYASFLWGSEGDDITDSGPPLFQSQPLTASF